MFIRVIWAMPTHDGHNMYHMYEATEYLVCPYTDDASYGPNGPIVYTQITLDHGSHDIRLGGGDKAYVMNNDGKTIDIISG